MVSLMVSESLHKPIDRLLIAYNRSFSFLSLCYIADIICERCLNCEEAPLREHSIVMSRGFHVTMSGCM
jgi:hypothetical protein